MSEGRGYEDTIKWLYDLSKFERSGMRLGLESVSGLCKRVGEPQASFPSIHVAGTNGKGSVSHMVESVLRAKGTRTGLYTSPHLQTFCERIKVEGENITEEEIVGLGRELFPHVEDMGFAPTFFDVTTTMAFMHFRNQGVEQAIVEVGLGGRLDSTNVLSDVDVCVVTGIGLEHTDVLGTDLGTIAMEKASIIKPGAKVVVGEMAPEAREVIRQVSEEKGGSEPSEGAPVEVLQQGLDGSRVRVHGRETGYEFHLPLVGDHQARNAGVAVSVLERMRDPPAKAVIVKGLSEVNLPGRFETVSSGPRVIIDGAHNPAAGRELARTVGALLAEKEVVLLVGMMVDKDAASFLETLASGVSAVVATRASSERAMSSQVIMEAARHACERVHGTVNIEEGLSLAQEIAGKEGIVLATGSFYIAGEVRQILKPVRHYL